MGYTISISVLLSVLIIAASSTPQFGGGSGEFGNGGQQGGFGNGGQGGFGSGGQQGGFGSGGQQGGFGSGGQQGGFGNGGPPQFGGQGQFGNGGHHNLVMVADRVDLETVDNKEDSGEGVLEDSKTFDE
ncbi:hypothetical protein JTB14_037769 [Gonioctena quinquepunctata]|nr:hypothetical protein JTB14_037769 [Gonioctena quinquepunctata]